MPLRHRRKHRRITSGGGDSYSPEILADSPKLYWKLDETSGTVAADSSGNGLDGEYINSPVLGELPLITFGQSMKTTGVGGAAPDAVRLASMSNTIYPPAATSLGWEVWFTPNFTPGDGNYHNLFAHEQDSASFHDCFALVQISNVGNYRVACNVGGAFSPVDTGVAVNAVSDRHLFLKYNHALAQNELYINGILAWTQPFTQGGIAAPTPAYIYAGSNWFQSGNVWIDEFAYYDHDVSAARIAAHYAAGI